MNENERDTHFQNFAHLVLAEIFAQQEGGHWIDINIDDDDKIAQYEQIIARCAYDLVYHSLDVSGIYLHPEPLEPEYIADTDEIMKHIPDMTEFPTQPAP